MRWHALLMSMMFLQASNAPLPQWTLIKQSVVGNTENGPTFGLVHDVVADSAGNAFVLDARNEPFIYAFAPNGRLRWRAGRSGEGPGEFRQPRALGLGQRYVWVADVRLRRFTTLDRNGQNVGNPIVLPSSTMPALRESQPLALGPERNVLVTAVAGSDANAMEFGLRILLLHARLPNGRVDTLAVIPRGSSQLQARISVNGSAGTIHFAQPFTDDPVFQNAKDGSSVVIVDQRAEGLEIVPTFRVTKLSAEGDTLFSRQIPYDRERLTDQQFDNALLEVARLPSTARRGITVNMNDLRSGAYRPVNLPPVKFVTVASDGTIWLHRQTSARVSKYLVLRSDGLPVATATVPLNERVVESNGSTVWTVPLSPAEEQILSSYRIERPKEGKP